MTLTELESFEVTQPRRRRKRIELGQVEEGGALKARPFLRIRYGTHPASFRIRLRWLVVWDRWHNVPGWQ